MSLLVWIVPLVAIGVPAGWSLQVPALVGPATIATAMACLAVPALVSYYAIEAPGIALGRVVLSDRRRRGFRGWPGGNRISGSPRSAASACSRDLGGRSVQLQT